MGIIENMRGEKSTEKHDQALLTKILTAETAATSNLQKQLLSDSKNGSVRRGKHEKCGIHFASRAPAAGVQSVQCANRLTCTV